MTSGTGRDPRDPWPDGPDDGYPGFRWPADPSEHADASLRRHRTVSLVVTAVLALGLGAGTVIIYRDLTTATTPTAAVHASTPAQGSSGAGPFTQLMLIGEVTAVGRGTVTISVPGQSLRAAVTRSTRFTGSVRALSGVRVGDMVAAQITAANGVAKIVSLQDPASQS